MSAALTPSALLQALTAGAGGPVDGMAAASPPAATPPSTAGLVPARAAAVLAAWSGTQLHAGEPGLLTTSDPDLALLVGDWCMAHALQALAQAGDLPAIGVLSEAIAACAGTLDAPDSGASRQLIWQRATAQLADDS